MLAGLAVIAAIPGVKIAFGQPSRELASLMDPAVIAANREGRLAPEQTAILGRRARRSRLRRAAEALACLGVAALLLVVAVQLLGSSWEVGTTDWTLIGRVALILSLLAMAFVSLRPWSDALGDDVRAGLVESTAGIPRPYHRRPGRWGAVVLYLHLPTYGVLPTTNFISIGDTRFVVGPAISAALAGGRSVRAYYLPRSMTLLSIETALTT